MSFITFTEEHETVAVSGRLDVAMSFRNLLLSQGILAECEETENDD